MESVDVVKLAARHYLYALFQSIFGNEPSEEQLSAIDAELCREALCEMGLHGEARDQIARFLSALQESISPERDMSLLKDEYTRLFIGPGKLPAPPWESMYLSVDCRLFTKETLEVRNSYRASGFIPAKYLHVADDHLALELDFMRKLAARALGAEGGNACREALSASKEFLYEHLGRWVGLFAKQLAGRAGCNPNSMYFEAALALEAFVTSDAAWLGVLE